MTARGAAAELDSARAALAHATRTQAALAEITARLTSLREPGAVLQRTVEEAVRLLDAYGAGLALASPSGELLRWTNHAGMDAEMSAALLRLDIPVGRGVVGRAFERREVVATADYPRDPAFSHLRGADHWIERSGVRSMVAAPLPGDGEPLGVLALFSRKPDAFGGEDRATVEILAHLAAIAVTNARRNEEIDRSRADLTRRAEVERSLREIGARLATFHDPTELLEQVVSEAARLVDADAVALDILDRETNRIRQTFGGGSIDVASEELVEGGQPADVGLVGLALGRNELVSTDEYLEDDRFPHLPEADGLMAEKGVRSMVAAPMRGEDGPLGVLDFYSRRPGAFGPRELAIIETFADQATIALSNARLIEALARSREELSRRAETERSLGEIAARIAAARDPSHILQTVVEEACRLIGSDGAHLTLLAEDGRHLVPAVVAAGTNGAAADWLKSISFSLGDGLHGKAAASREVLWTEDSLRDRAATYGDSAVPAGRTAFRAVAVAPLNAPDGAILGTLAITYGAPRVVDPEALRLLETLADHATVALMNSRLESDLRVRATELAASEERARLARELHDSVTQALFSMTLQTRAAELLLQKDAAAAAGTLASLRDLQRDALAEMRSLVFELRPAGLADTGLEHALRTHAAAIEGRIGLPVAVEAHLDPAAPPLPLDLQEAVYRIAQEALHNVVRHARASRVRVDLDADAAAVRLRVVDDGVGFDPELVAPGHLGLDGMRARAERLGGSLGVEAAPGHGTTLDLRIPRREATATTS
jgi:signal transduction histidine kinase